MRMKLMQTSGVSIRRSLCRTSAWCLLASNQAYTEERGGGSSLNEKEPNHCSQKQT